MRPIQPLVRLPHSHIDPNWLSTVERASRTRPREFYEWAADLILSVTGSLPGSRLVVNWDLRDSHTTRTPFHRDWPDCFPRQTLDKLKATGTDFTGNYLDCRTDSNERRVDAPRWASSTTMRGPRIPSYPRRSNGGTCNPRPGFLPSPRTAGCNIFPK